MTKQPESPAKKKSSLRENAELICEVLVYVLFINAFLLQTFGIPTPSMEDHMLIGDHLLVDRVAFSRSLGALDGFLFPQRPIRRGDIVVIKAPPEVRSRNIARLMYVKRVIGLPGERLKIVDNQVYIDSRAIAEPYRNLKADLRVPPDFPPESPSDWWTDFPLEFRSRLEDTPQGVAFKIPEGHYFCMGDNRNLSADSRVWGPVPADNIVGKPWRNYWSFEAPTEHYLGKNIFQRLFTTIVHFIGRTRWERTLKKF